MVSGSQAIRLPVLYVPGFISSFTFAWYLERMFERVGYEFHSIAFPWMATGDMVELARELKTQVEAAAGQYLRVNLVCHSAGGLIARYYIQKLSRSASVSSVVFLGTPHQGTVAAYPAFLSRACRQMTPGSDFMDELDTGGLGRILTNRALSIYSNHDILVLPSESGRLAGSRNMILRGPLGHALPLDPRAFAAALAFIEEMAPA
jgi:triacylglycerol esterase/lipase EstA (alpha/beta hydrolase family)